MNARVWLATALLLGLASIPAIAQDTAEVVGLGKPREISARALALGGSYTAVANDFAGLYYNPAGLTGVRKREWHMSLQQSYLGSRSQAAGFPASEVDVEDIQVQSLGYIHPVPTERGGLSFGFGYYRPRTFEDAFAFADGLGRTDYTIKGDMNHYRVGMGLELSPQVVVGLGLSLITGRETVEDVLNGVSWRYVEDYFGYNVEPALMVKISERLRAGISLVLWENYALDHYDQDEIEEFATEREYVVRHPEKLKLGLAYQGDLYLLAMDYKVNGWSRHEMEVSGAEFPLTNPGYDNEHILSVGMEHFVPAIQGVVRGGYTHATVPLLGFEPTYTRHRASAGLGFVINGSVALDLGYAFSFWEGNWSNVYQEYKEHVGMLSLSYRY